MEDTDGFKEMMRMDFKEILNLIEPDIMPQLTNTQHYKKCLQCHCEIHSSTILKGPINRRRNTISCREIQNVGNILTQLELLTESM